MLLIRWVGGALLSLVAVSTVAAQDAAVVQRLVQYGGMSREHATQTVQEVSRVLSSNASQGGDRYDSVRRTVNLAIYGEEAGPGATRDEYNGRLGEVLARLTAGLDVALLEAFFAQGEDAELLCAHNFGVTIGECDALIAAATRQPAVLPYVPPTDGSELEAALRAARVSRSDARQILRALRTVMLGLPANLTQDDRGRGLLALLEACPGGLDDRAAQIRAWHVGPTEGMARCIASALGPSGAALAEQRLGMNVRASSAFVAWGATQVTAHRAPSSAANSALPAQPELAERWRQEARRHFQARRFPQAAAGYEASTTLDPEHPGGYAGLGAARLAMGDPASAVVAYQHAVRLAPTESRYHSALGRALAQSGDRQGAVLALQRAYQLDPNNVAAREGLQSLGAVPAAAPTMTRVASHPTAAEHPPSGGLPERPAEVTRPEPAIEDLPSRDVVINTMRPLQPALEECAPSFDGSVAFNLTVRGQTGEVIDASMASGDVEEEAQRECMVSVVRGAGFPRFARDTLMLTYPYEL